MISIWNNQALLPAFPKLEGNIKTEVLIIGGGMAGILCAHFLRQAGIDYVLAESRTICSGVTKNTTAKITVQHSLIYDKMLRKKGAEKAGKYLAVNQKALEIYADLCRNKDCDFERRESFVYSLNSRKKLEQEVTALHKIGGLADFTEKTELPFEIAGAVKLPNQAQFHPLKFVSAISRGLHIYEHTHILEVRGHTAIAENGTITAGKIIISTHFPFLNRHGSYFIKQYQHRSYVMAWKHAQALRGMYVDEAETGMSFRSYKNMLLIGGGDHRTGKKGGCYQELETFVQKYYPDAAEQYRWAAQDCMTLDSIPYIGLYSKSTPDLYVSTGFNKWGMTSSMVSAMLLSDRIMGRSNDFSDLFSPSRSILTPQLPANLYEAVLGMLTPTVRRCPHLGCALRWNSVEHSWDCSCHGSRFDSDGVWLDNPATRNLR
ncbi:MAG: FAD-dependent oxidoreductase [Lachnospiraceae bacterium]